MHLLHRGARLYHRDAHGEIVKLRDDVLSAARYAMMTTRFWKSFYESGLGSVDYSRRLGGIDYSRRGGNTQTVSLGSRIDAPRAESVGIRWHDDMSKHATPATAA